MEKINKIMELVREYGEACSKVTQMESKSRSNIKASVLAHQYLKPYYKFDEIRRNLEAEIPFEISLGDHVLVPMDEVSFPLFEGVVREFGVAPSSANDNYYGNDEDQPLIRVLG